MHLNQPPFKSGLQVISRYLAKNNVFGEPQVEMNDMMALMGDRVRGLKGFDFNNVGNPRTLAEFDQMINAVAARGQKRR